MASKIFKEKKLPIIFNGFQNMFAHDWRLWKYIIMLNFTHQKSPKPVVNYVYKLFVCKYVLIE